MEHSKEFYNSVIRVIDYLQPDVWDVMPEKGEELAGNYWPEIGRMLKEDYNAGWFDHGRFHITRRSKLPPLKEDCKYAIEKIEKAEKDRTLNNKGIKVAIWCGIGGMIISIASLILSIIALSATTQ